MQQLIQQSWLWGPLGQALAIQSYQDYAKTYLISNVLTWSTNNNTDPKKLIEKKKI